MEALTQKSLFSQVRGLENELINANETTGVPCRHTLHLHGVSVALSCNTYAHTYVSQPSMRCLLG